MKHALSLNRLLAAWIVAAAAVVAAIVIQGVLFHSHELGELHKPSRPHIRDFSVGDNGHSALMLYMEVPPPTNAPVQHCATVRDLSLSPFRTRSVTTATMPWMGVAALTCRRGFINTLGGELLAVDWTNKSILVFPIGSVDARSANFMECSRDGALVISGGHGGIAAWSRDSPGPIWRRPDIHVTRGCFFADSTRFMCGLESGEILELDVTAGTTLRRLDSYCGKVVRLAVSPDGARLLAVSGNGFSAAVDTTTSGLLWTTTFAPPPGESRFTPDGQCLIAPCPRRTPRLVILSSATGVFMRELVGAKGEIRGLEVTPDGRIIAFDAKSAVTTWNLLTGQRLSQNFL